MWAANGGCMASKSWVRAITAAAAVGLLIPVAVIGQGTGGGAPGGGTGGTTGGSTGGSTGGTPGRTTTPSPSSTTNPSNTPSNANIPQPIFVAGRVMLEDGTAPPGLVTLETVCNSAPHGEGYADSEGYFSIKVGASNEEMQKMEERA